MGIAYRVPDPLAVGLAVEEKSLPARRKDSDAKAPYGGIADVQGLALRSESIDPSLGKACPGHGILPGSCCTGGSGNDMNPLAGRKSLRENAFCFSVLLVRSAPKVRGRCEGLLRDTGDSHHLGIASLRPPRAGS